MVYCSADRVIFYNIHGSYAREKSVNSKSTKRKKAILIRFLSKFSTFIRPCHKFSPLCGARPVSACNNAIDYIEKRRQLPETSILSAIQVASIAPRFWTALSLCSRAPVRRLQSMPATNLPDTGFVRLGHGGNRPLRLTIRRRLLTAMLPDHQQCRGLSGLRKRDFEEAYFRGPNVAPIAGKSATTGSNPPQTSTKIQTSLRTRPCRF